MRSTKIIHAVSFVPCGGVFRYVNLLVPPEHPEAQAAWCGCARNAQFRFAHPERPDWAYHSFCLFAGKIAREGRDLRAAKVGVIDAIRPEIVGRVIQKRPALNGARSIAGARPATSAAINSAVLADCVRPRCPCPKP